jgi:hypothetical protein
MQPAAVSDISKNASIFVLLSLTQFIEGKYIDVNVNL